MEKSQFCAYDAIIIKGHVFSLVEDTAGEPCGKCKLLEQCINNTSEGLCYIHGDNPYEYYDEVGEVVSRQITSANGKTNEILTINFY